MRLSEMRELLAREDIQLTKSLGQNFLHDANQLRRIVDAAELRKSDRVLEIGPGLGPLTEVLVANAGEVLAIEKDTRLVEVLRQRFALKPASSAVSAQQFDQGTLSLLHADALEYLQNCERNWRDWKLVANLPYSVASPILVELAQSVQPPMRMVVTLQWEVARRLFAAPGNEDYGVLTLLVQLNFEPRDSFKIPASCFFPAPDVDSACVCLVRRAEARLGPAGRQLYVKIVKRAFSQRRKMMMKLLKQDWPANALESVFARLSLSPTVRAEELGVDTFVALAGHLASATPNS